MALSKTWAKKAATKGTFVFSLEGMMLNADSDTVLRKVLRCKDDEAVSWDVTVTLSPPKKKDSTAWEVTADLMSIAEAQPGLGGKQQLVTVLASGAMGILWRSTSVSSSNNCRQCGSYGYCASGYCSRCQTQTQKQVDLPLQETCVFHAAGSTTIQAHSNLIVSLDMTHFRDLTNEPTLPECCGRGNLSRSVLALLDSGTLADVTFVVAGEEVKAHSQILGAVSEVFRAMFLHDTKDSRTRRIEVQDASPAVFKEMLRCLYSDSEPQWTKDDEWLFGLLFLAEKYNLQSLRLQCERRVLSTMRVANVCSRLKVVNLVVPDLVHKMAFPFIKAHLQDIVGSKAWLALQKEDPILAADVMRNAITL